MRSTPYDDADYEIYLGSEDADRRVNEQELREEAEIDAYIEEHGDE